jgi:hypothetical protein
MAVPWSEHLDEVIGGDHVVGFAYVTPARGVVLLPMTNFAVRDREAGVLTSVNSSVGAWKKLERLRRNPNVALAFHTRRHALNERPEYVLVQGRASLCKPIADYPSTIAGHWERFEPWRDVHPVWKRWQRVYALRVAIDVAIERIVVWPDLGCRGVPEVLGAPWPEEPPAPQKPPRNGTGPRLDQARASAAVARLPDTLLGWVGADGLPVVVPVSATGSDARGMLLDAPEGMVPPGGRRAGLTAHWFSHGVIGQNQRKHTGWLEADAGDSRVVYAPHTQSNYRFPSSLTVFRLVSGGFARVGLRQARRSSFWDVLTGAASAGGRGDTADAGGRPDTPDAGPAS